jgi:peptidoglycan/LPS O-acetylase OafA/YrhL
MSPPERLRLPYLDGLRALASLYVVGFHSVGFTGHRLEGPWRLLRRLFAFGHEAVGIFIVLSGYCLMLPLARSGGLRLPSLRAFAWRRAVRILPPYYVSLALSLALLASTPGLRVATGTIWDNTLPGLEPHAIVTHLLLVHNLIPDVAFQINGPHWSVATEWQIYFLFPLLLLPCWRALGPWGMLAVAVAVGYSPLLYAKAAASSAITWYLSLFGVGLLSAWVSVGPALERVQSLPWGWLGGALSAACGFCGLLQAQVWFRFQPVTDLLVGVSTGCVLVALTRQAATQSRREVPLRLLEHRALVSVGKFSYSLYLTHLPVLAVCWLGLGSLTRHAGIATIALLSLGAVGSAVFAYAFHRAFERPFFQIRDAL